MFVKRFLNTVRFWQSFVLEIIFPVAFVIIALIVAKFVGELNSNEVKRSIMIQSSTRSDNRTLFWAQFGSGYPITFTVSVYTYLCAQACLCFIIVIVCIYGHNIEGPSPAK